MYPLFTAQLCVVVALSLGIGSQNAKAAGQSDWLVTPVQQPVELTESSDHKELVLSNGLIRRTFRTAPNFATTGITNLSTDASVIRGVKPEAVMTLDGQRVEIGGLDGQNDYAFLLPECLEQMTSSPDAFQLTGYSTAKPKAPYDWKPTRRAAKAPWPPLGLTLTANFEPPEKLCRSATIFSRTNGIWHRTSAAASMPAIAVRGSMTPKRPGPP
jgi:hypothetical protein